MSLVYGYNDDYSLTTIFTPSGEFTYYYDGIHLTDLLDDRCNHTHWDYNDDGTLLKQTLPNGACTVNMLITAPNN